MCSAGTITQSQSQQCLCRHNNICNRRYSHLGKHNNVYVVVLAQVGVPQAAEADGAGWSRRISNHKHNGSGIHTAWQHDGSVSLPELRNGNKQFPHKRLLDSDSVAARRLGHPAFLLVLHHIPRLHTIVFRFRFRFR